MENKRDFIVLENRFVNLIIDRKGNLTGLVDKNSGKNYCTGPCPFWDVKINNQIYLPSKVSLKGQEITVYFNDVARAVFAVQNKGDYSSISLVSISPESVNEVTLARLCLKRLKNIALKLNASYDDKMAFCIMALTLPVHCFPADSAYGKEIMSLKGTVPAKISLTSKCYSRYGIQNNRVAIIGCPSAVFRKTIEKVESNEGLPCIKLNGRWGKDSQDIKRSYLFIQDMGENNCDRVIEYAKTMDVGMIMILETWCKRTSGHYPIDEKLFPDGIKGLKKVVDKIHSAGMKAGLHFLVTGVTENDRYITPVPDKRLFKDGVVTLSEEIKSTGEKVPFIEHPTGFPEKLHSKGLYYGNGMDIQIDDEIITYGAFSTGDKNFFTGCKRGAYGTKPALHKKGAKIYHLKRSFTLFVTDIDTSIIEEIARRISYVFDHCGFDMAYFDGSERLQGDQWYYNARMQKAFYDSISARRRNKILYQGSSYSHFSWHMMSRAACADGFTKIKDNVNNAMSRYTEWFVNLMPLDIGWYELGGPDVDYSDVEYILCRSIGWGSSCGFETCSRNLKENPERLKMIGNYERLRLSNYFSEGVKAKLRKPGEYNLTEISRGKWRFRKKA